jgi:hypothetical protein
VAMLTILRTINQHRRENVGNVADSVQHNDFKIIYVLVVRSRKPEKKEADSLTAHP